MKSTHALKSSYIISCTLQSLFTQLGGCFIFVQAPEIVCKALKIWTSLPTSVYLKDCERVGKQLLRGDSPFTFLETCNVIEGKISFSNKDKKKQYLITAINDAESR
jgi:hypothetical protein